MDAGPLNAKGVLNVLKLFELRMHSVAADLHIQSKRPILDVSLRVAKFDYSILTLSCAHGNGTTNKSAIMTADLTKSTFGDPRSLLGNEDLYKS